MAAPPRSAATRRSDLIDRLENDKDLWMATASLTGEPCLVPLSFLWDGSSIFIATVPSNPTARNIDATGRARAVLGHTRDVGLIDATAQHLTTEDAAERCAERYAEKCGWNPLEATKPSYAFFELTPDRIESWRELNEHDDRLLMSDQTWVTGAAGD
jgi:hypothetical protein